ncbi:MAG: hypothetical protein HYY49_00190 [Ignavibacteriales bacterium]|nr:hypothetical protein [Ignavibacteriales bacterium]
MATHLLVAVQYHWIGHFKPLFLLASAEETYAEILTRGTKLAAPFLSGVMIYLSLII